jgi:cytoskeletal protein CcmA (bactofilin family)
MEMTAHIGASILIKGDVSAKEPLTVAGRIVGTIDSSGQRLTVTESGRIEGDVVAHTMIVAGHVTGRIDAGGLVVVQCTATVEGDLTAPAVTVDDGARLHGRLEISGRKLLAIAV